VNAREILEEVDELGATITWDPKTRTLGSSSYLPEELIDAIEENKDELLKIMGVDWQGYGTHARFPKEGQS
jgi:hypothetical protein